MIYTIKSLLSFVHQTFGDLCQVGSQLSQTKSECSSFIARFQCAIAIFFQHFKFN